MRIVEHTVWELETTMSPGALHEAIVDFGPDRGKIWLESSHPKVLKVHAMGPTWADVTEGVTISWSREHYDWSTPGVITLTQVDSNVAVPTGTIRYTLVVTADGTHIACDRHRTYRGTVNGVLVGAFMRAFGRRVLRWQFERGLARAATLHHERSA